MPLTLADWREACRADSSAPPAFAEEIRLRYGAHAAFAVSSGRAALWLALRALSSVQPERRIVILPAYTCPTVGRAVQEAGLQGLCADISLQDFCLDPEAVAPLLDERVLAVVAPHMFGTVCDVGTLAHLCRGAGAALIEDLAQCCGAHCRGREVGTWGDLAFNSLGRSKNLRGAGGGVLWVNRPEFVVAAAEQYDALPAAQAAGAGDRLRQLAVILLSAPRAWDAARRVPLLRVGAEDEEFEGRPSRLAPWQAALGSISLARVARYNEQRTALAAGVVAALGPPGAWQAQQPRPGCDSTRLRLALRLCAGDATSAATRLQQAAVDGRVFYSRTMVDYSWWQRAEGQPPCRQAQELLRRNLVLPLHHAMGTDEAERLARTVEAALSDG